MELRTVFGQQNLTFLDLSAPPDANKAGTRSIGNNIFKLMSTQEGLTIGHSKTKACSQKLQLLPAHISEAQFYCLPSVIFFESQLNGHFLSFQRRKFALRNKMKTSQGGKMMCDYRSFWSSIEWNIYHEDPRARHIELFRAHFQQLWTTFSALSDSKRAQKTHFGVRCYHWFMLCNTLSSKSFAENQPSNPPYTRRADWWNPFWRT